MAAARKLYFYKKIWNVIKNSLNSEMPNIDLPNVSMHRISIRQTIRYVESLFAIYKIILRKPFNAVD